MWIRLRQIALVARELRPVIDDLSAVLGIEPCYVDPGVGVFGLENTLLPVGNQFLEVVAPIQAGTAGGRYLDRRGGDGGYMVITQTDDHAARRARVAELGVRVAWGFDAKDKAADGTEEIEYRCMQLHPRDTGATFFEIDEQGGDRALEIDGPWHPAGPDWQRVKRVDVTRRRLVIAESISEVAGQVVWSTPKTHQTRSVPVPRSLMPGLVDLCAGKAEDDPVFTSPTGGPSSIPASS